MWIVYFAAAVALLGLGIIAFQLARGRAAARDSVSSSDSATIASVFVNIAALLVALIALYVAFQSLNQSRRAASEQGVQVQPRRPTQPTAKNAASATARAAAAGPNEDAAQAGKPDVRLAFEMSARGLGVILVNDSESQAATEIGCQARLWVLDDPDDDSFSEPIATPCGTSYLNPRGVVGPTRLVEGPSHYPRVLQKFDRFFGYVTVSCPRCLEPRGYTVYFVLGTNRGWYAPADPSNLSGTTFIRDTAEAAAGQFLTRADKLPIRFFWRL